MLFSSVIHFKVRLLIFFQLKFKLARIYFLQSCFYSILSFYFFILFIFLFYSPNFQHFHSFYFLSCVLSCLHHFIACFSFIAFDWSQFYYIFMGLKHNLKSRLVVKGYQVATIYQSQHRNSFYWTMCVVF